MRGRRSGGGEPRANAPWSVRGGVNGSRSAIAAFTWATASARILAVRSAAVGPGPKRSDNHASAPLKSHPRAWAVRSMAPPRPVCAAWSHHFPAFCPVPMVTLKPSALQRSGSALSC